MVRASSPSTAPIDSISPGSHVAPSALPQGTRAAVTRPAPSNADPRAPFGPSVTVIAGMPASGTPAIVHMSWPAVSVAFCSSDRPAMSLSMSTVAGAYGSVMDMLEGIATTHAIRRFRDEPVTDEQLATILFAATRAPSGSNRQPFRFLVFRDGEAAVAAKHLLGGTAPRVLVRQAK